MSSLRRLLGLSAVLTALVASSVRATTYAGDTLRYRSVDASYGFTCAITTEGALYCWGASFFDREPGRRVLGREVPRAGRLSSCGFAPCRKTPLRILEQSTFEQIDAGATSCAIQTDGKTLCWGFRGYGQSGVGERLDGMEDTTSAPPREVQGGARFVSLAVGADHVCALAGDSTAWCWGNAGGIGVAGERCRNGRTCVTMPTKIRDGTQFIALTAANDFTCGLHTDGKAECWGVGLRLAPSGLTFRAISAGFSHGCAVGTDSLAYCWGRGAEGQLGTGSTANSASPVPVSGGLHFRAISAGDRYTCGLTMEGAAHCWGAGSGGQLGAGDKISSNVPRPVAGGLRFQSVSVGHDHSCAITGEGVLYCWGKNGWGNLGTGGRDDSMVPVRVSEP